MKKLLVCCLLVGVTGCCSQVANEAPDAVAARQAALDKYARALAVYIQALEIGYHDGYAKLTTVDTPGFDGTCNEWRMKAAMDLHEAHQRLNLALPPSYWLPFYGAGVTVKGTQKKGALFPTQTAKLQWGEAGYPGVEHLKGRE